jgi:hypothetical protein
MVLENIEYMTGGRFENLSGMSVPKSMFLSICSTMMTCKNQELLEIM